MSLPGCLHWLKQLRVVPAVQLAASEAIPVGLTLLVAVWPRRKQNIVLEIALNCRASIQQNIVMEPFALICFPVNKALCYVEIATKVHCMTVLKSIK